MFKVGLTGGIGSGKSATSDTFASLGVHVVDADIVAREVVEPGTTALKAIEEHFGVSILESDGGLDRKALRQIIFSDPTEKDWLERLLHPIIRDEIIRQLNEAHSAYSILVSPLLFETDQHLLVDRSLLIDVPEALQLERAAKRDDSTAADIRKIMDSQMPRLQKLEKADDIICNDASLEVLRERIKQLHQQYLQLSDSI